MCAMKPKREERDTLRTTGLIRFAQIYRELKRSDCYEHRVLNITPQSLKHNERSLLTQYIAILRHPYTLYIVQVVAKLAIIKTC